MENLKDEQIKNQGETITSLERKVESLERELQKVLTPYAGESLPEPPALIRNERLADRIYIAITALFLPVKVWGDGLKEHYNSYQPWWAFRQLLFDCDLFDNHWSQPEFRLGLDMLNDMCQATDGNPTKLKHFDKYELASRLFGGGPKLEYSREKAKGVEVLISALLLIIENQDRKEIKGMVSMGELNDTMAALKGIQFFQRLWLDAKDPVEKEEENQE